MDDSSTYRKLVSLGERKPLDERNSNALERSSHATQQFTCGWLCLLQKEGNVHVNGNEQTAHSSMGR
jgi:hypothetical protein